MSPGEGKANARCCIIKSNVHIGRPRAGGIGAWLWCLCFCGAFAAKAQDTLVGVEVTARKTSLAQLGKKTETIDSTIKQQFKFNSVGDVLSLNTPVFIKSYGPGGITTTAFRGGNASQTAVLWNGFNIQNAMLGQADLALMPSVLFEDIGVEYGGSSSLWGSGAVGGSIHLDTKSPFNAGLQTTTNLGAGSFGLWNGSTRVLVSRKRFVSSTKLYWLGSQNNFTYKDSLDKQHPEKQQQHANYDFKGLMQELKFLINARQILLVNAWLNSNYRNLPAFDPSTPGKTNQLDQAIRLSANWSYVMTRFKSTARAAFFSDRIDYNDSVSALFSKSKVNTFIAESDNYLSWHQNHQFNFGANFTTSSGSTDSYNGIKSTSRLSVLAGNKFVFFNRLQLYAAARLEYFSAGALPLTGNVSAEYVVFKHVTAKINAARVYRQPTLNELYWVPGGNINLKPEQGYTFEGELNYRQTFNRVSVFVSGAAYSRKIDNWILWVPGGGGNTTPINVQQVWSRGTETTWRVSYKQNKLQVSLGVVSGYVLSTIEQNGQENSDALHRQLIYTPRYTINGNAAVAYDRFNLVFFHQYIGYRFTTTDNTRWLPPYQVSSIKFNYRQPLKNMNLLLFVACNNVFNASYTIIAGRPMPPRNFEVGLTIQTLKRNKTKDE